MLNTVIRWALRNRTLVLALAAGILVWGAFTAQRAPVEVFPRFATPRVTVQTEAPGFPPRQVEQQVTYPLEDALLGLQGVQLVRSHSIAGLSVIKMIFQAHTNLWVDRELVSQALAAAPRLPPGVGPARLTPATSAIGLIAVLGLTSSRPMTPAREFQLRTYAQWVLRRRLLALPGVADVTVYGGEPKQYEVEVSPARLRQFHLTLAQVLRAAGASNAQGAGGFFQTPDQDLVIHASGLVTTLAQLRRSVVTMRHGAPVTLGDIATVRYGAPPPIGGATINGKRGVILQVFTQPDAGTVPVTRRVDAALAVLRRNLPAGMRLEPNLFRQANFIRASIGDLRVAMWEGGLLVILVLLLFLRSWRASLISILAIPLSLFLAIIILVSFGATLNTMTLGGLVLALGEVVDDAIIDVENISRRMRETRLTAEGEGRKAGLLELVYRASTEVRSSVVHATLAVALVFVPIFFLGGLEGRIFTPLGEAYILSTLSSLLVALTVTPVLAYWLLPGDRNIAAGRQTAFAHWLQSGYERIVAGTLGHPRLIGAASLAAAAAGLALVPFMGGAFLPSFNQDSLIAHMASLSGTSLPANLRAGAAFERQLLRLPNIASADQRDGRSQLGEDTTAVNYSEFDVRFKPTTHKTLAQQEAEVRRVAKRFPAFAWSVDEPISERINEVLGGDTAAVAVKIFGPKEAMLARFAARARNLMAGVRGAAGVSVEQQVEAPEVNIGFDRRAAQAYGVTSRQVATAVQTALVGDPVGRVFQGQDIFPLVVKLPRRLHGELARIRSIPVAAPSGAGSTPIPLSAVARVRVARGLAIIQHQNGVRMVAVQSDVSGRPAVNFVQAVERRLNAGLHLPAGYYYSIGGQFASRARAIRRLEWLGLFALIGILFLLQYAFRNWRDAWLVIVNVPLAFIGGILAVELSGSAVSVATLAGFITLFGITLRNGIMLVSHYQHLEREEGETFGPALVIRGARERLVPILMTALAYGLALLPIVLESGRPGGALEQPMAVVILGGLATSTILNLLVVPALYLRYARPVHPAAA